MVTVEITLPDGVVDEATCDAAALQRLALEALLIRLYALGEIGSGLVADLLGISRREALERISSYGVSTFDETMDLEAELRILADVTRL